MREIFRIRFVFCCIGLFVSSCSNEVSDTEFQTSRARETIPPEFDHSQYIIHTGFSNLPEKGLIIPAVPEAPVEITILNEGPLSSKTNKETVEDSVQRRSLDTSLGGAIQEIDVTYIYDDGSKNSLNIRPQENDRFHFNLPAEIKSLNSIVISKFQQRSASQKTKILEVPVVQPIDLCSFSQFRQTDLDENPTAVLNKVVKELLDCGETIAPLSFDESQKERMKTLEDAHYFAELADILKHQKHPEAKTVMTQAHFNRQDVMVRFDEHRVFSTTDADNALVHETTQSDMSEQRSRFNVSEISQKHVIHALIPKNGVFDSASVEFIPPNVLRETVLSTRNNIPWRVKACFTAEADEFDTFRNEHSRFAIQDMIIHNNSSDTRFFNTWLYNPFNWSIARTDHLGCMTVSRNGGESHGKRQFEFYSEMQNDDIAIFKYTGWDIVQDVDIVGSIVKDVLSLFSPKHSNNTTTIPNFNKLTLHEDNPSFENNFHFSDKSNNSTNAQLATKAAYYRFYSTVVRGLRAEGLFTGEKLKLAYPAVADGLACPYNHVIYLNRDRSTFVTPAHELAHIVSYKLGNTQSYFSYDWLDSMFHGLSTHNCVEPENVAFNEGMAQALARPILCEYYPENKECRRGLKKDVSLSTIFASQRAFTSLKEVCEDGLHEDSPRNMFECLQHDRCMEAATELMLVDAQSYVAYRDDSFDPGDDVRWIRTYRDTPNNLAQRLPPICVSQVSFGSQESFSWKDVLRAHSSFSGNGAVDFGSANFNTIFQRVAELKNVDQNYLINRMRWPFFEEQIPLTPFDICKTLIEDDASSTIDNLCENNILDEAYGETDLDCGGPFCQRCQNEKQCYANDDCYYGKCADGVCRSIQDLCSNGQKDILTDESWIDCGGDCEPCQMGQSCHDSADCEEGLICGQGPNGAPVLICQSPEERCQNGVKDPGEGDIDCGGPCVQIGQRCSLRETCLQDGDCYSDICRLVDNEKICSECTVPQDCFGHQTCMAHMCHELVCPPGQIIEDHQCKRVECETDSDCWLLLPGDEWFCIIGQCRDGMV